MKHKLCSIHTTPNTNLVNRSKKAKARSSTAEDHVDDAVAKQAITKSGIKPIAKQTVPLKREVVGKPEISSGGDNAKTRKAARQKSKDYHDQFSTKRMEYATKWKMSSNSLQHFEALLGHGFHTKKILASDVEARKKFSNLAIDGMIEARKDNQKNDNCRSFFITIVDDAGITLDREPEFDLHKFQTRIRNYIQRDLKLNAFGVIEVQAVTNHPQKGEGRYLLFHCHLIAWTYDPDFDPKEAMKTKNFSSKLSVKPVVIKKITDTEGDIAHLGHYLTKSPLYGKRRVPCEKSPTGYKFKPSKAGMRPELCLRVSEVLSHFTIRDLVFAIGEGAEIRKDIFTKLTAWHRKRDKSTLVETLVSTERLWERLRCDNGSKLFQPPKLIIKRPSRC